MKTVSKSVLIWYRPEEMYALVTDVASYPQFLPWCDHARVIDEDDTGMTAEVGIAIGGVRQTFTTRNTHTAVQAIDMQLVKGPFSQLDGHWRFIALGDGSQRACRVALDLNYGFDNATLGKLVGPVFDRIAASLVDAFVKRASQVYGD
ncbi:MAG: type II toxin-antitoxin system RatA family toxin [Betaproteobacteria bacterium]